MERTERVEAEWIILADSAEVVNNKLYVMGGGWDTLTVNTGFPAQHSFAIAAAFRVPWSETNQLHDVELEIADADHKVLATISAQIEVGRPAGIPVGHAQRIQMAVRLGLALEGPGTYVIVARIAGEESKRIPFNIVPGPAMAR